MKTFTILAVTGGLFFASVGLNSRHVKNSRVCAKINTAHCMKKCCNGAKKTKAGSMNQASKPVVINT
ncbi:MAG: hypothetical protein JWR38_4121 [Mucilaginibacter sp.]|nr:hypothetical protein [Mucilaginibacter sp.]